MGDSEEREDGGESSSEERLDGKIKDAGDAFAKSISRIADELKPETEQRLNRFVASRIETVLAAYLDATQQKLGNRSVACFMAWFYEETETSLLKLMHDEPEDEADRLDEV